MKALVVAMCSMFVGACGSGAGGTVSTDGPQGQPDAAAAAGEGGPAVKLTHEERVIVETLSPLPPAPPDPSNRYADDPRAAALGQRLFFESGYSGPLAVGDDGANGALGPMGQAGRISCQSCHRGDTLDDRRSRPGNVSLGADYLGRNAPTLLDASHYRWVGWAGRFSAQWELPLAVAENPRNMNSDRLRVAHTLFDKYRLEYEAVFGPLEQALGGDPARFPPAGKPKANAEAPDGPWERMTAGDRAIVNQVFVNYGKALAAYLRRLASGRSRFDDYAGGHDWALAPDEVEGLRLFIGRAGCVACHKGPQLSDGEFHNLGVRQRGDHAPASDLGRFTDLTALLASPFNSAGAFSDDPTANRLAGVVPGDDAKGQFRTPSLRNVAGTAPYMHAGQLLTLEEVVDYYDRGGDAPTVGSKDPRLQPLALSPTEKAQLVAFLRTLTAAVANPALLEDTSTR